MNPSLHSRLTRFIFLACALAAPFRFVSAQTLSTIVPDGKPHKFEARNHNFYIDGQPTMLMAGEMHFGRVQPEDWDMRIKQAKAMGLNAISFYLFWNMVETKEGQFTFTGMTDVRRVLKLCQDNGMWAILRPGPYCCAEIEYGGIPYWTLKYPDVKIRTSDPKWLDWSKKYLAEVYKQVGDLQVSKGGPLVMVQIENEIGITKPATNDYMVSLQKIFQDVGFDCQLFTCDPSNTPEWTNPAFRLQGVMMCRNGLKSDQMFNQSAAAIGDYPVFVPEVYTAWFSGWSEPITSKNASIREISTWMNYLIDHNYSFCIFMFFGGTNYGFYNGSNFFLPVQTSYDYSAPVDEAGRTTPKFNAMRDIVAQKFNLHLPAPPPEPVVIEIPAIKLDQRQPLLATLPASPTKVADKPVSMENLDQDYGFVLYRKKFEAGVHGVLELKDARDYAIVMVNGKTVGESYVGFAPGSNKIELNASGPATLDILVYNLGRLSVITSEKTQYLAPKGLIGGAALDGTELTGWEMYSLPYASVDNFKAATDSAAPSGPTFYRGTFTLSQVGGTFLDMSNWKFGAVWINGHNLGRYWNQGGLGSLFVPSQWLKPGQNEIIALELQGSPRVAEIAGVKNIVSIPAAPFANRNMTRDPTQ